MSRRRVGQVKSVVQGIEAIFSVFVRAPLIFIGLCLLIGFYLYMNNEHEEKVVEEVKQISFEGWTLPGDLANAKSMGFSDCKVEVGSPHSYRCDLIGNKTIYGVEVYRAHVFLRNSSDTVVVDHPSEWSKDTSKLRYDKIFFSAEGKTLFDKFQGKGWFGINFKRTSALGHPDLTLILKNEYAQEVSLEAVKRSTWEEYRMYKSD